MGPRRGDGAQEGAAGTLPHIDGFHLAQVNVGIPLAPLDTPQLAGFVEALEPINAIADAAPGFVWRLQDETGDATAIRAFEDERLMINMSVWESRDALWRFVYESEHLAVMRRRREWFERMRVYMALWWIPAGALPTVEDARDRLAALEQRGPTAYAFTFKRPFSAVGVEAVPGLSAELSLCD